MKMEQLPLQMLQEDVALFPLEKQLELQKAWEQPERRRGKQLRRRELLRPREELQRRKLQPEAHWWKKLQESQLTRPLLLRELTSPGQPELLLRRLRGGLLPSKGGSRLLPQVWMYP